MFEWLRGKRLSKEARKKLLVVQARSEEAIIETHVHNVLEMLDILGDELDPEQALEEYTDLMQMDEVVAAAVANRVLARSHGQPAAREGRGSRFQNVFRDERGR